MIRPLFALALGAGLWAGPAICADLAFVTSQNADMLSVVDLADGRVLAQTPVADAPAPVLYDPAEKRAYVIAANSGLLSVIDEVGAVIRTVKLPEGAFGMALAPGGGVFVTEWYQGRLLRLDRKLAPLWDVATGRAPAGVAADGPYVATADRDDDRVSIFDAQTGALRAQVTVGKHPYAITFHDGRFWTADVQSDTVSVIDPASGRMTAQIKTGSHPYGVAFAGGRGFVTDQYAGTVTVFDDQTLEVIDRIETGDYPEGVAPLPDGSGVVVAHWDSNTLVWIDAATLKITREIDMPDGPRAFGAFTGRQR